MRFCVYVGGGKRPCLITEDASEVMRFIREHDYVIAQEHKAGTAVLLYLKRNPVPEVPA